MEKDIREVLNRLKENEEKKLKQKAKSFSIFLLFTLAVFAGIAGFVVWASLQETVVIDVTMVYGENFDSVVVSVEEDGAIELEDIPEWEGYDIKGWYTEENFENQIDITKVEDMTITTLYAKWGLKEYEIKYYLYGGTNSSSNLDTYTMETETFTIVDPETREGYTFEGWYTSSAFIYEITDDLTIETGGTGDVRLFAKWEAIPYDIIHDFDEGAFNPNTIFGYTAEYPDFTILAPTKDGYTFVGWYEDAELTTPADTYIESGSTGDIYVYAKWEEN